MESFNTKDYEKEYGSPRKQAKAESKLWKDRKIKTYKQFAYFRYRVRQDSIDAETFLKDYLSKAWSYRHIDEEIKENLREALHLTIYLKTLYNYLK